MSRPVPAPSSGRLPAFAPFQWALCAVLLAVAAPGCSTHRNHLDVAAEGKPTRIGGVVVPPIFVEDVVGEFESGVEASPIDDPSFRSNTIVGNIRFGPNGYTVAETDDGQFNVSTSMTVTNREKYREQVEVWLADALGTPAAMPDTPPPLPVRTEKRGTDSRDGRDNISLPRGVWRPVAAEEPGWSQPIVVPWVITYTSHNAGWFFGQTYGTGGGARIHVLLAAYDTDGRVLGWTDVNASRISERTFSPTGPELQDLLLKLERRVGRKLR